MYRTVLSKGMNPNFVVFSAFQEMTIRNWKKQAFIEYFSLGRLEMLDLQFAKVDLLVELIHSRTNYAPFNN